MVFCFIFYWNYLFRLDVNFYAISSYKIVPKIFSCCKTLHKSVKLWPQGLEQARPQNFPSNQIGGGNMVANLTLPGDFAFQTVSNGSMVPDDPGVINGRRQAVARLGSVTISIS